MEYIRFAKWANKNNIILHLEANGNALATYGTYDGEIKAYDIEIDTTHTLDNKPLIMAKPTCGKGYITFGNNLLDEVRYLKKYTITYKIYVSGINPNAIIYPFSACTYDNDYHDYIFDNCRPIHEFRLEKNLFVYKTSHYMAGMIKKNAFPQNEWVFVTLSVDCSKNNETQMRLYINGELMSLGYATSSEESSLEYDIWEMSHGLQNRIELPGLSNCNYYALAEFTVYNDCIDQVQTFRPPELSTYRMLRLTTSDVVQSLDLYKQTVFIDSQDNGRFIPNFGTVTEVEIPTSYNRKMDKIAYIGDEWSKGKWTELVSDLTDLETVSRQFIDHGTTQDILNTFSSILLLKPDIVVITCGYYDTDIKKTITNINSIVELAYSNSIIPIIVGYTRTHEKTKWLNELHKAITDYWYSSKRPPVFYYVDTYSNNNLVFHLNNESHDFDDIHLSDIGEFDYAALIVGAIEKAVHYEKFYRYPRSGYLDINAMMSVTIREFAETRYIDCRVEVTKPIKTITKQISQLTIPWPYPLLKLDTPFILLDNKGKFVPSTSYTISSNNKTLVLSKIYVLDEEESFKFIFAHNHGFCNIKKIEVTYTLSSTRTYPFHSPFNKEIDLKEIVQVYCNYELLDKSLYTFNNRTGAITLNSETATSGSLILVCFYTSSINDQVLSELPESGYFEFINRDRIWDKNLYAVFVNGKLVNKNKIKDMNSYTHKITEDIKSRYGFEVLNMSPLVNELVPYLNMPHNKDYYYDITGNEIYCTMTVDRAGLYKPRNYVEPATFSPKIDLQNNHYITLVHKKTTKNINYSLKFFCNCYHDDPILVNIVGQVKSYDNNEEFDPDREDQLLIYQLPIELTNVENDMNLFSIQPSDIYEADPNTIGNGVLLRLEVAKQLGDKWSHLYYDIDTDDYEHGTEIYALEWVISTEANGEGEILYRKSIGFTPYKTPNFIE